MTTQAIERRIHIAAPDAPSAFALERRLAHPITEVWAAITEPARLADCSLS